MTENRVHARAFAQAHGYLWNILGRFYPETQGAGLDENELKSFHSWLDLLYKNTNFQMPLCQGKLHSGNFLSHFQFQISFVSPQKNIWLQRDPPISFKAFARTFACHSSKTDILKFSKIAARKYRGINYGFYKV